VEELPQKNTKDYCYDSVKAGFNLFPFVGGALATVFETVFSSPIDTRKEAWLCDLAKVVDDLCNKVENLTPEKLSKNEEFISAYLLASNIAIRSHQKEKLTALRAAVKNTVLITDYDESMKMIFIRVIDEMTPLHFRLLTFLSTPNVFISELNKLQSPNSITDWGSLENVWDETYKDIRADNSLIDIVISDLHRFGFVHIDKFHKASMNSVSTSIGKQFVAFINES